MRPSPAHVLACALLIHSAAEARSFAAADLLKLADLGGVTLAPGGRWAVVQTFAPWDQASAYDLDWWTRYGLGRLHRVDLSDGAARPLLHQAAGCGYVAGPISPSGGRMAVSRLCGHAWELGVVDLATGEARWLGVAPELAQFGREILWRSDDNLLVIAQSDHPVGQRLGFGWQGLERLTDSWSRAAAGRLSVSVLGSGRYRDLRARASPKRLLTIDLASGDTRPLLTGDLFDQELSPDGRVVAVLADGPDIQDPGGQETTTGTARTRRRLILVDLETGRASEPCPTCDVLPDLLAWSPGGERLLVFAREGGAWPGGAYRLIDATSGTVAPIPLPGLSVVLPKARDNGERTAAAWLGDQPVIYARRPGEGDRADWYAITPDGPQTLTGHMTAPGSRIVARGKDYLVLANGTSLWKIGLDGAARRITRLTRDLVQMSPPSESERLGLTPPSPTDLMLTLGGALAPLGAAQPSDIALAAGDRPLAVASDLKAAIVERRDPQGAERLLLRRAKRPDVLVLGLNLALDAIAPAEIREIDHRGPDGQPLKSWLYLPPGLPSGTRAPLVVVPYPGEVFDAPPSSQAPGSARLHVNAQVLAGAGYAVLMPSLPMDPHREPMDGLADQVLAVVDAAVAQAPVDSSRLAVWGHSYGGYAALALATESPCFKAVIAGSASADMTSVYARQGLYNYVVPEAGVWAMGASGWSESGQARMNGPPWRDPGRYWRNSPISFVDRITAPLMLIAGDKDNDPDQSEEMFTSLYRLNKDAILLVYHGESHVVSNPENLLDQYARALAFLREHIGPPARSAAGAP